MDIRVDRKTEGFNCSSSLSPTGRSVLHSSFVKILELELR